MGVGPRLHVLPHEPSVRTRVSWSTGILFNWLVEAGSRVRELVIYPSRFSQLLTRKCSLNWRVDCVQPWTNWNYVHVYSSRIDPHQCDEGVAALGLLCEQYKGWCGVLPCYGSFVCVAGFSFVCSDQVIPICLLANELGTALPNRSTETDTSGSIWREDNVVPWLRFTHSECAVRLFVAVVFLLLE